MRALCEKSFGISGGVKLFEAALGEHEESRDLGRADDGGQVQA
jgi:hypothetical protein